MKPTPVELLFAYLSALATVATAVTAVLFFTRGERFGRINDASSVFQMVLMLPLAGAMFLLTRARGPTLSVIATGIGVAGLLVAATLQALLVFRSVGFEDTIA